MRWLFLALLLVACSSPKPSFPIRVVGDGEHGVVREHEELWPAHVPPEPRRIVDRSEWRAICQHYGGVLRGREEPGLDWYDEFFVVVPIELGVAPVALEVSSEEGVDVVTIDVDRRPGPEPVACISLLRLTHREHQLAVVVRNERLGEERTVAVFDPY